MYALNDTVAAITEVQRFLYVISNTTHPEVTRVAIDGIWGAETERAVAEFQRSSAIEITGKVDYETFDALYVAYSDAKGELEARDYLITNEGFPLKINMMNDDVLLLHILISEIQKTYDYLTEVSKTTYYSATTEKAVLELQELFGIEVSGSVDAAMFERLIVELDSIKLGNSIYN